MIKKSLKNINLLHTFECAARHNSYSRAAVELGISQAAISQQMRLLENNLATKMFIRKGKSMLLSQQGEVLLAGSQAAFKTIQKTLDDITNNEIAGSLTISSTQAFTTLWLMPKLGKFSAQYPNINIRVQSSAQFEDLEEQHIDLAIRFGPHVKEHTNDELICEYFGEDAVYPVCSAKLAEEISLKHPKDLLNTWLVTLEQPGCYDWFSWFKHCNTDGYQHHQQWTKVHSTDMALNAVLSGHGITLAASYLCNDQLEAGLLVKPINIAHPNVVKRYFVFDKSSSKLARLQVFTRWLKQEMDSKK